MSILSALDRFVHASRLDILTPYGGRRARNLRRLPIVILAALPIGYALLVASLHGKVGVEAGIAGGFLFFGAVTAANLVRLFGPRLGPYPALDEREAMIKARAGSLGGFVLNILVIAFFFYCGCATIFGAWLPVGPLEWIYLGLGLQAAVLALPVLIASWLQREPDLED